MPDWTSLRRAGAAFLPAGHGRRRSGHEGAVHEASEVAGFHGGRHAGGPGPEEQPAGPPAAAHPGRHAAAPAPPADVPGPPVPGAPDPGGRALLEEALGPERLAAVVAVTTEGGRQVLPGRRPDQAGAELAALDGPERERVAERLRGAPDVLAAYLVATVATGRGGGLVDALVEAVAGHARDAHWLHRNLGVVSGAPGPATYEDDSGAKLRLRQLSPVTSGPAAMIVLRVLLDPTYGYWLTTGVHVGPGREADRLPFEQRFRSQQALVQEAISRRQGARTPLPRLLGSPPAASARFLNRFTRLTGSRYGWLPVDGGDPAQVREALVAVGEGIAAGVPVPLFVGGHADRTAVLAFGRDAATLRLYDPSRGEVLDIATDDIVAGRPVPGGWDRLEGVLAPQDA